MQIQPERNPEVDQMLGCHPEVDHRHIALTLWTCEGDRIKNAGERASHHVTSQHLLVAIDLAIAVTRRQKSKVTRIKWFKLKDHDLKQQFKDRVLRDIDLEIEDVNEWWNRVSANIIGRPDSIPVEVWKALDGDGVDILHQLMKEIMEKEVIPEKWSVLILIFKEKGDVQSCENYLGIKLMFHTLKLLERILDSRLRQVVHIGRQQLGFMKGVGTIDDIFSLRQTMEKHHEKLQMAFIDLEKAYDRVPRQEVWRGLKERGVQEKYVRIVQECYKDVSAKVRSTIRLGVYYTLMTLVVLVEESRRTLERKLEERRVALESRGMGISRSKTEYFTTDTSGNQQATIKLNGTDLKGVENFKYLGW
ncbi:uncharacterized protein LOC134774724 [Penaeus indicus]|uniref:uncharacterized protein LOC134774724 n=1 Tax=Penaeus indicus TaxID=29960 RepID=UPI00300D363C